VTPEEWDWTRTVVDHLDIHASRYTESVRFYEVVLAPLGIPKLFEREKEACFTHVNVVDRQPPTLNLCTSASTPTQRRRLMPSTPLASLWASALTARPVTETMDPATTPPIYSIPTGTTSRRCTET
jgi:hypothetical protein